MEEYIAPSTEVINNIIHTCQYNELAMDLYKRITSNGTIVKAMYMATNFIEFSLYMNVGVVIQINRSLYFCRYCLGYDDPDTENSWSKIVELGLSSVKRLQVSSIKQELRKIPGDINSIIEFDSGNPISTVPNVNNYEFS
jgi:hypothetical protein